MRRTSVRLIILCLAALPILPAGCGDGGGNDSSGVQSEAYFTIVSRNSGRLVGISGGSKQDGAAAILADWPKNDQVGQHWKIEPAPEAGYYYLINADSGKYLDVENASTQEGATVQQYRYTGGTAQQWKIVAVGEQYHKIVNRNSGLALNVEGDKVDEGAAIIQWPWAEETDSQWLILPPDIVAVGDMETGNTSQYQGFHGHDQAAQLQFEAAIVRQGTYAAKFKVRPGDRFMQTSGERAELSGFPIQLRVEWPHGNRTVIFNNRDRAGDDLYYAWSTYFPTEFAHVYHWGSFINWHSAIGGTVAPLSLSIDLNQNMIVKGSGGECGDTNCQGNAHNHVIVPAGQWAKGVWHEWHLHKPISHAIDVIPAKAGIQ
ncbi:MAG: RICIN domain-containing protein [Gammaproteobacteria bacterium]|nr:RICIN domain-containing protein [Gammaproteobacteria bacterium]